MSDRAYRKAVEDALRARFRGAAAEVRTMERRGVWSALAHVSGSDEGGRWTVTITAPGPHTRQREAMRALLTATGTDESEVMT